MSWKVINLNSPLAQKLADSLVCPCYTITRDHFPDGESYLRLPDANYNDQCLLCADLFSPDTKIMPLILAANTLREHAAKKIGLLAPYLPYMRQDIAFNPGEAVSAGIFANLISQHFDVLWTVDPHLHRINALDEIYRIPAFNLAASPLISNYIQQNIQNPILIGPDMESEQWVSETAMGCNAPWFILEKLRHSSRNVEIHGSLGHIKGKQPVLVDDIISTGYTMSETVKRLLAAGSKPPVCICVHGLFVEDAYNRLLEAGAARVISCNSITHESNAIDLLPLLTAAITSS